MISVVLPTYNRAGTLKRAIDSVLMQDEDLELLVVDDASTDATQALLSGYTDPRMRVIRLSNHFGACHARNEGIRQAHGEYIAFQDSDDCFCAGKLCAQRIALEESGADVNFCAMERYDVSGALRDIFPGDRIPAGPVTAEQLLRGNLASTQTLFGRAECFRSERFDERFPRYQDWELVLRLAARYRVYYTGTVGAQQFLQADSISGSAESGYRAVCMLREMYKDKIEADDEAEYLFWYIRAQEGRACRQRGCLRGFAHTLARGSLYTRLQRIWRALHLLLNS